MDTLVTKFVATFLHGHHLAIDKSLIHFTEHFVYLQYIPTKPVKCIILVDALW